MDTIQAIFSRRSVRHFKNQPIAEEDIELLLKAAMQSPSAANSQPWQFVIIEKRDLLEEVTKFHPNAECLHQAPVAILVCGDERLLKKPNRWILDCSAATQNILLAAHSRDLGAVWLGIYPDELRIFEVKKLFDLPPEVHPLSLVAIGHPARTTHPEDRFKPERIHRNTWQ